MTLLAGCMFTILSLAFAAGLVTIGDAATADARAQLTADAAALAAVAESAPGGSGLPASAAYRYAELNGGRVVECICVSGAQAMQVTVAVDDALATARAEIDTRLLRPPAS
ncbi:MAG: hypothetical protein QOG04_1050 [Actinomycetota bacterium]|jgi:hypothetical protein|nr:hypothetical protein [Actinomycetota bacterium]